MISRIVETYLKSLQGKNISFDDDFINAEYDNITDLMRFVNLPDRAMHGMYIDTTELPVHLGNLYNDIDELCYSSHSAFVTINTYDIVPRIVSMLVEKMYKQNLVADKTLPRVLYIDTESLIADLNALVARDKRDDIRTPRLRNSLNVIYDYIYYAQVVFWDRFRLDISTSYYYNFIYEVIKGRYNDCLSNVFFSNRDYENFLLGLDPSIVSVLDLQHVYPLAEEQILDKIKFIGEDGRYDR